MANVVMAGVGAVVGFFAGGPAGALYGAQIGFAIGSYVQGSPSQTVQGPKIGEVATQNAKEGVPRPIVFGVARPIAGNIIASGKPVITVVREKVDGGGGGKGGGGGGDTYQEREEVHRTYAIRICEGPVNSVRRIWRDNKLVYDALAEPGSTQAENNAEFLKVATLHLGGYDQMPDPALQAEFGVNNVTAHRGTCYMVMDTEDLTPRRGSIPSYIFEVARGEGFYLTSEPYVLEEDAGDIEPAVSIESMILDSIIVNMEENAGDVEPSVSSVDYINLLGPIEENAGDMEPSISTVNYLKLPVKFGEEAGDVEPAVATVDYIKPSVSFSLYTADNTEDVEPAISVTEITLNA